MMIDDWDASRRRFEAWWAGDVEDRLLFQVLAPADGRQAKLPEADSPTAFWTDVDFRIAYHLAWRDSFYYGGDAFPWLDSTLGPGTLSLYLGAMPGFSYDTVWYNPCFDSIRDVQFPVYNPDNQYWNISSTLAEKAVKRFAGTSLVSIPDLIEGLDTIASLIGTEQLLVELMDCPHQIPEIQDRLTDSWFEYYNRLYDIVKDEHGGVCFSGFHTYGQGRMAKLQCDFSAMISPRMFQKYAIPWLQKQCQGLDKAVYHLDGPDAVKHLDALLEIPELNAIQWTPGAGQPEACWEGFIPMFQKIRSKNKSVMLRNGTPQQVQRLVETLGPEGLDIMIWVDDQSTAEQLVKASCGWRKSV